MRIGHERNNPALVRLAVETAAAATDWLGDLGFPFSEDVPAFVSGHELYSRPRTYWGGPDPAAGGIPIMDTLLKAMSRSPSVEVQTGVAVADVDIEQDASGARATGVVLEGGRRIDAGDVVLATGGYAANRALVGELQPDHASALTGCLDHATGDGHTMLRAHGVALTHTDTYVPTMGMIEDPDRPGYGVPLHEARVIVDPARRAPWEIWVNERGERFVAEDAVSPFEREAALRKQPGLAMWVIGDATSLEEAPPIIGPAWDGARIRAEVGRSRWLRTFGDLAALAHGCRLPETVLGETVAAYNDATSDPLGRSSRPSPIARPPFFAIRVVGGMLLSRGGPQVDEELRPIGGDGRPILSLYAVGELLGMGQFSGDSFAGGMSVGPALALGRHVVSRIAARRTG